MQVSERFFIVETATTTPHIDLRTFSRLGFPSCQFILLFYHVVLEHPSSLLAGIIWYVSLPIHMHIPAAVHSQ